jgi:hypothetical protein
MTKFEAMHGLAIKKFGTPAAVADLLGAAEAEVQAGLEAAVGEGFAMGAKGAFMLTPKGQQALAAEYPAQFAAHRADAALSAGYERFEVVNTELKQLITDWQTMTVAGETVPNDHSDAEYDNRIIDRLGGLHERAEPMLAGLAAKLPRLKRYAERLANALDKAESGEIAYVSGAKIDSYHTVWFELHEDLIRVLDRKRDD